MSDVDHFFPWIIHNSLFLHKLQELKLRGRWFETVSYSKTLYPLLNTEKISSDDINVQNYPACRVKTLLNIKMFNTFFFRLNRAQTVIFIPVLLRHQHDSHTHEHLQSCAQSPQAETKKSTYSPTLNILWQFQRIIFLFLFYIFLMPF